ncbi:MAG: hypothetical protein KGN36_12695 [Acidobacteriota bacterium]|nr:hypothetical protein [Acidobacteriota bacterium]
MLGTLLSSLTSLSTFLSRAFLIAAFIPTLLFVFLHALLLYLFNWGARGWLEGQLIDSGAAHRGIVFAALFIGVWIGAYLVAALTPLWTRTLEGRNWGALRKPGTAYHRRRYDELTARIDGAVGVYARIEAQRAGWRNAVTAAARTAPAVAEPAPASLTTAPAVERLRAEQAIYAMVPFADLDTAYTDLAREIGTLGVTPQLRALAEALPLITDYASRRAQSEHSRLLAERNMSFGIAEDIAPTEFGNVGLSAEAYAMRAYQCNLTQIWGALRQATQKDDKLGPALEDAKMQLDFLVASYFLFLGWSLPWAVIFALRGEMLVSAVFALGGPWLAWALWYGAAVERYRVMQDLITSLLDSLRLQVLGNLHLCPPLDLEEERALWRALDLTIGNGQPGNLRYRPGTTP